MYQLGYEKNAWRVSEEEVDLVRMKKTIPIFIDSEPQRVKLDLYQTALIIVDMQNDFCSEGGWLAHIGADISALKKPVHPLNSLMPILRELNVPIIWVNWGNRSDRMNISPSVLHVYNQDGKGVGIGDPLPENGSRVLEKDSWGASIVDELEIMDEDIYVDKFRMSGFWDTPLDSILRNLNIKTTLFAGVNLDQCVMSTLQDAVSLGYDAVLLDDCCATNSPQFCTDATLFNVKQCYGFVAQSTSLIDGIKNAK